MAGLYYVISLVVRAAALRKSYYHHISRMVPILSTICIPYAMLLHTVLCEIEILLRKSNVIGFLQVLRGCSKQYFKTC